MTAPPQTSNIARRPRFALWCRASVAVALAVAVLIVLLNVFPLESRRHGDHFGWPYEFVRGYSSGSTVFSLRKAAVLDFQATALVLNVAVAIVISSAAGTVIEIRFRRGRKSVWQFSLTELLSAGLVFASALGWAVYENRWQEAALKRLRFHFDVASRIPHAMRGYIPNMPSGWLKPFDRINFLHIMGGRRPDGFFEPLAEFTDVADLEIEADFTDGALKHVAQMPGLECLKLESPRLTGEGLKRLAALRRLRSLRLCSSRLSVEGIRALTWLDNVEVDLELRGGALTGTSLEELQRAAGLRTLRLTEAQLDDGCLAALARLTQVQHLVLEATTIEHDSLLLSLSFDNLRSLRMHNVQGVSVETLKQFRERCARCSVQSY